MDKLQSLKEILLETKVLDIIPNQEDEGLFTLLVKKDNKKKMIDLFATDLGWWFVEKSVDEIRGELYISVVSLLEAIERHHNSDHRIEVCYDIWKKLIGFQCKDCLQKFQVSAQTLRETGEETILGKVLCHESAAKSMIEDLLYLEVPGNEDPIWKELREGFRKKNKLLTLFTRD